MWSFWRACSLAFTHLASTALRAISHLRLAESWVARVLLTFDSADFPPAPPAYAPGQSITSLRVRDIEKRWPTRQSTELIWPGKRLCTALGRSGFQLGFSLLTRLSRVVRVRQIRCGVRKRMLEQKLYLLIQRAVFTLGKIDEPIFKTLPNP